MKFGLNFTPVYPGEMAGLARVAEDAGYESLWIGEHVLVPFDAVPEGDRGNFRANSRFLEPWVALAHLAAVTSTVRLGTCVAVLPLHHPVHLARAVATVDVLSNGRVSVGAGIGLIPAEYSAVNEDYGSRGARLDEMIEVMNVLFREAEPEFHGRYFDFRAFGIRAQAGATTATPDAHRRVQPGRIPTLRRARRRLVRRQPVPAGRGEDSVRTSGAPGPIVVGPLSRSPCSPVGGPALMATGSRVTRTPGSTA